MLITTSTSVSFAKKIKTILPLTGIIATYRVKLWPLLFCGLLSYSATFSQAVSGSFTVNPALASGGSNFKRIGEVDTFLMARGINGPVDIKIYNGTYNQANMVLNTVPGASATNTIKFSSFSNDS